MKQPEYIHTPQGWKFILTNTKTKAYSEGYPTKKMAEMAAKEILNHLKRNK